MKNEHEEFLKDARQLFEKAKGTEGVTLVLIVYCEQEEEDKVNETPNMVLASHGSATGLAELVDDFVTRHPDVARCLVKKKLAEVMVSALCREEGEPGKEGVPGTEGEAVGEKEEEMKGG